MNTLELIDEIMRLSGPFTSEDGRRRHRRWLQGRSTDKLLERRQTLLETSQRPTGQTHWDFAVNKNLQIERQ